MRPQLTMALSILLLTGGCGSTPQSDDVFGEARDSMPRDPATGDIGGLARSCTLSPHWPISIDVAASLMPLGFREPPLRQDSAWSPNGIADVALSHQRLAVLDAMQGNVSVFDTTLTLVAQFGRPGSGPGEFLRAGGILAQPQGGFAVVDQGNGRLVYWDSSLGISDSTTSLPSLDGVLNVAMGDGRLYFSRIVLPEMFGRGPFGIALGTVDLATGGVGSMLDLEADKVFARDLLALPGPNPFRVVHQRGYTLLIAPAIGEVLVYRGGRLIGTARSCMPRALRDAYQAQLAKYAQGVGPRSQQHQPLVTDAMVKGDTIITVGPLKDTRGRFHLDYFGLDGTPIGSAIAELGDAALPREIRFWGSEERLLAFGPQGTLLVLTVRQEGR